MSSLHEGIPATPRSARGLALGVLAWLALCPAASALPYLWQVDRDPSSSFLALGEQQVPYAEATLPLELDPASGGFSFPSLPLPDLSMGASTYSFSLAVPLTGTFDSLGETVISTALTWIREGSSPRFGTLPLTLTTGEASTTTPLGEYSLLGRPLDAGGTLGLVAVAQLAPGEVFGLSIAGRLREVPEPGSALLLALGLAGLAARRARP